MNRIFLLLIILMAFNLKAQQCSGSFGDPIFTETFGDNSQTGNNYGPQLPNGVTTYDFINFSGVSDGDYTIAVNGNNGRGEWHNTADHTNDLAGQGNMLIVNAAYSAGEFYRRTVTGLCENQVFEFSAWIINLLPGNFTGCSPLVSPNVKFRIEDTNGTILGETDSGNLLATVSPQWKRFSFDFQIPVGYNEVQVVLMNNSVGGCGNDLAIDDISFRPCSNKTIVAPLYADFENGVCKDDLVALSIDIENNPYNNPAYQWQESLDGGQTWTDMAGETGTVITVSGFIDGHMYRYYVAESANINNPNCRVNADGLTINYFLPPANKPENLIGCNFNGNGVAEFDLTETIPEVLNNEDDTNYFITFHNTAANAENGDFAIINMFTYQNSVNPQEIFVRVVDRDKGCYNTTNFLLEVKELPSVNSPVILWQCDDDIDGFSTFNLYEANGLINPDGNLMFTYYLNRNAAETENAAFLIADSSSFSNAVASTVYTNVKDENGCFSVAEVSLQVSNSQIPQNFELIYEVCDDGLVDGDNTNGVAEFNFSDATGQILNLFPSGENLGVSYYQNEEDALSEQSPISPNAIRNTSSPFEQIIYVRVDNKDNNACFGLGPHIRLVVNPLPVFDVQGQQTICLDQLPKIIFIENPQGNYNYEWTNQAGNVIGNAPFVEVMEAGVYIVTASTTNGTNCSIPKQIVLSESERATINNIKIVDAMSNNTVTVEVGGIGDYEFSLDGSNYQDSNIFENVVGGTYTLSVRDKYGCGIVSEEICVVGFPAFFTPNGDFVNDTWQVLGVEGSCYEGAIITIFDRYGKLLEQLNPKGAGWDGTMNGKPMPSSDYWFSASMNDQTKRTIKGHFTLKRK